MLNKANKKYCRHCLPQKRRNHFITRVGYYSDSIKSITFRASSKKQSQLWPVFVRLIGILGVAKFESQPDRRRLYNRSLIFFEEAKKRGIEIYNVKILGYNTNDYIFKVKNKTHYYEGNPINSVGKQNNILDDKYYLKKILKGKFPIAKGQKLYSLSEANILARNVGYPLVVKPAFGSLSQHATYPISNGDELKNAVAIAKKYSRGFILEKYIEGNLYRITVIGKQLVYTALKDRPNVFGDGKNNIKKLIQIKNKSRKPVAAKNSTIHKIKINEATESYLEKQDLSLKDVIKKDQKIYLSDRFVLSHGCDVVGMSDFINKNTKNMFLKLASKLDTDLVGFDFICKDISRDYKKQECAIIEANSMPYVDMHQSPSLGNKDKVAKDTWDIVVSRIIV